MTRTPTSRWTLRRGALAILCGAGLLATGCVRLHGPRDLRRELSASAGVRLEREMGFTVTRSGIWLARWGLKFADEEDVPVSLKGVRRVQVGIYNVDGSARGYDARSHLDVDDLLPGWQRWVRIQEDDEDVLVLVNEKGGDIRGMVVVVAAADEWVLVRVKGNLQRVVEDAMRMAFDQAERPDLYARSREERGLEADPGDVADLADGEVDEDAELASWDSRRD
jgi:hypothetical protein